LLSGIFLATGCGDNANPPKEKGAPAAAPNGADADVIELDATNARNFVDATEQFKGKKIRIKGSLATPVMTVSTTAVVKTIDYGGTSFTIRLDINQSQNQYIHNEIGPIDKVDIVFLCKGGTLAQRDNMGLLTSDNVVVSVKKVR
jgi:hypothetical protein